MSQEERQPTPMHEKVFIPFQTFCVDCGKRSRAAYHSQRVITTLNGTYHLRLKIRRCQNASCHRYHQPYRPEEEGK